MSPTMRSLRRSILLLEEAANQFVQWEELKVSGSDPDGARFALAAAAGYAAVAHYSAGEALEALRGLGSVQLVAPVGLPSRVRRLRA